MPPSRSQMTLWVSPVLWAGALCLVLGLALFFGGAQRPTWQPVAPGVHHRRLDARDVKADLLRFDLDLFELRVEVLGQAHASTAAGAASRFGSVLAINGGFFDPQWRSLGLRVSHGETKIPLRPRVDWGVLALAERRARIVHSRDHNPKAAVDAAIQVGPRLLVDGKPTQLKPQLAYRSAVAVDPTGRLLTFVSTRVPVEAGALAAALARLEEFQAALLLDGGPSSQLYVQLPGFSLDRPGAYPVPDLVLIHPRTP
ncbi:MAG: phosphodiester glycosidase family protein [Myxococcales bacterium]|nr:phosphodiester glycosidase family protein [Myxococcales bacterium]